MRFPAAAAVTLAALACQLTSLAVAAHASMPGMDEMAVDIVNRVFGIHAEMVRHLEKGAEPTPISQTVPSNESAADMMVVYDTQLRGLADMQRSIATSQAARTPQLFSPTISSCSSSPPLFSAESAEILDRITFTGFCIIVVALLAALTLRESNPDGGGGGGAAAPPIEPQQGNRGA